MATLPFLSAAFYLLGFFRIPFLILGFVLQCAYILSRGTHLGRLPIVGPHDTLFFMAFSTPLFGFPIAFKAKRAREIINPVSGLSLLFMTLSMLYKPHDNPLPPVLKTFWFETHVAFSFFSYALFGIGAALGISALIGKGEEMERLQYKTIFVGYSIFSAAMVFGGIWAYLAWGTYWLWTPKELWTVILWLFYTLYLHARLRKWWTGRPSLILGILGFFIVMFTYLGVSLFMKSSHSF